MKKKLKVSKAKDVSFRKIIALLLHAFGINLTNVLAIKRVTNVFVSMDTMELIVKLKRMSVKVFLVKTEVGLVKMFVPAIELLTHEERFFLEDFVI